MGYYTSPPGDGVTIDAEANGNDYTLTGDGGDVVRFGNASNNATVEYSGTGYQRRDELDLVGLTPKDVVVWRSGSTLYVTDAGTGKTLTVFGQFDASNQYGMATIKFADGTTWDRDAIVANAAVRGDNVGYYYNPPSDGATVLAMSNGNDFTLSGTGGDTFVFGSTSGSSRVEYSGSGYVRYDALRLSDLSPSDVTLERFGNDLVVVDKATGKTFSVSNQFEASGSYGLDSITFADGTSLDRAGIMAGTPVVGDAVGYYYTPPNGVRVVDGGAGHAWTLAGAGGDVFTFSSTSASASVGYDGSATKRTDALALTDLTASQVTLTRYGNDLQVWVNATGKSFYVSGQFDPSGNYGLSGITFADGTGYDRAGIAQASYARGDAVGYYYSPPVDGATVQTGANGNAYSLSGTGSDHFRFGSTSGGASLGYASGSVRSDELDLTDLTPGQVRLTRSGNDLVVGDLATGKSFVVYGQFDASGSGTYGLSTLRFADGTTLDRTGIAADAWVYGDSNNYYAGLPNGVTVQTGTGGNQYTLYGTGGDLFRFGSTSANAGIGYDGSATGRTDQLDLTDLTPSMVRLSRQGDDLRVTVLATGKAFTASNQFDGTEGHGLTAIAFADGTSLDRAGIEADGWVYGDMVGYYDGLPANATVQTGSGGNAYSVGQAGSSTYRFGSGSGSSSVSYGNLTAGSRSDTLVLTDLAKGDVTFARSGDDLVVTDVATGRTMRIQSQFSGLGVAIVEFDDGSTMDAAEVATAVG